VLLHGTQKAAQSVPKRQVNEFSDIVGVSESLLEALELVRTVAPTDSTVHIEGETGTGKELVAQAIHNLSARRERPFVKLNCAAIPFDLLESELFGHEKGAFTGAISLKIGRFEMADRGTLFLDEIGDSPLTLQPKLLRVLQEQEFERLGSGRTHRINVRLVAATHRDLSGMVACNEFRADLYYRAQRVSRFIASIAPPSPGYSSIGQTFCGHLRTPDEQGNQPNTTRRLGRALRIFLAWKRAGTAKPH
jgi:transcriptional regulator with GAF, ATPase, and Fis domain